MPEILKRKYKEVKCTVTAAKWNNPVTHYFASMAHKSIEIEYSIHTKERDLSNQ